jgi:hypothetical protein
VLSGSARDERLAHFQSAALQVERGASVAGVIGRGAQELVRDRQGTSRAGGVRIERRKLFAQFQSLLLVFQRAFCVTHLH